MTDSTVSLRDITSQGEGLVAGIAADLVEWDKRLADLDAKITDDDRHMAGRFQQIKDRTKENEELAEKLPALESQERFFDSLGWFGKKFAGKHGAKLKQSIAKHKRDAKDNTDTIAKIRKQLDRMAEWQTQADTIRENINTATSIAVNVRLALTDIQCAIKMGIIKVNVERMGGETKSEMIDQIFEVGRVVFNNIILRRLDQLGVEADGRRAAEDTGTYLEQANIVVLRPGASKATPSEDQAAPAQEPRVAVGG